MVTSSTSTKLLKELGELLKASNRASKEPDRRDQQNKFRRGLLCNQWVREQYKYKSRLKGLAVVTALSLIMNLTMRA